MTDAVANVMWQCAVFCDMSRMLSRCHKIRCEPGDHMCDDDDVFTPRIFEVTMNRCDQGLPGGDMWWCVRCRGRETGGGTHYCFCFFDRVFSISSWILLYSSVMTRWWEIVCADARTLIIQDKLVSISKNKTSLFNPWPPPRGLRHHDYRQWNQFYKTIIKRRLELTSKICPN